MNDPKKISNSYYEEFVRTRKKHEKESPQQQQPLLTDRAAYMAFLELQLERANAAAATAQASAERVEQLQSQVSALEERIMHLTRLIKLNQNINEEKQSDLEQECDTLGSTVRKLEKTVKKLSKNKISQTPQPLPPPSPAVPPTQPPIQQTPAPPPAPPVAPATPAPQYPDVTADIAKVAKKIELLIKLHSQQQKAVESELEELRSIILERDQRIQALEERVDQENYALRAEIDEERRHTAARRDELERYSMHIKSLERSQSDLLRRFSEVKKATERIEDDVAVLTDSQHVRATYSLATLEEKAKSDIEQVRSSLQQTVRVLECQFEERITKMERQMQQVQDDVRSEMDALQSLRTQILRLRSSSNNIEKETSSTTTRLSSSASALRLSPSRQQQQHQYQHNNFQPCENSSSNNANNRCTVASGSDDDEEQEAVGPSNRKSKSGSIANASNIVTAPTTKPRQQRLGTISSSSSTSTRSVQPLQHQREVNGCCYSDDDEARAKLEIAQQQRRRRLKKLYKELATLELAEYQKSMKK